MTTLVIIVEVIDPHGTSLYRAGGASALAIGSAYVLTVVLYAQVGPAPAGGEAALEYFAGKTTTWWTILALAVLTDLLFIPVALALYLALKDLGGSAMLVATALVGLFVALDLSVTWTNHAALIGLSADYTAAANDAQRAAAVAAASYASAVLNSPLERVYAIVILSSGILVTGLVMLRGVFDRMSAYLAVAVGVLGILSIAGLTVTIIANALLATVWVFFVGYRLFRLGR